MQIGLGSGSPLKTRAVQDSFPNSTIHSFSFPSIVNEQPVGREEIEKGALYRANEAKNKFSNGDLWIGIENGIINENNYANIYEGWEDIACIIIIDKNNTIYKEWSNKLKVPISSMKECMTDDGNIFKTWSPLKDPHSDLTNGLKPRRKFLQETIEKIRKRIINNQ